MTTMLFSYPQKEFAEKLNELKVGDDGITPTENNYGTMKNITLKITTHGDFQFISGM